MMPRRQRSPFVWAIVWVLAALAFFWGLFIANQLLTAIIAVCVIVATALLAEIGTALRDIAASSGGE